MCTLLGLLGAIPAVFVIGCTETNVTVALTSSFAAMFVVALVTFGE